MTTGIRFWSLKTAIFASGMLMVGNIAATPITHQEVKVIPCAGAPATNYMKMDATQVSECLDSGVGTVQGTNAAKDAFLSGVGKKGTYEFLGKSESANNPASKPGSKTKTKIKTKTKTKAKPNSGSKFEYSPSGSKSVSVPEPGTLALLGLGIVGLLLARWRTRTRRADDVS